VRTHGQVAHRAWLTTRNRSRFEAAAWPKSNNPRDQCLPTPGRVHSRPSHKSRDRYLGWAPPQPAQTCITGCPFRAGGTCVIRRGSGLLSETKT